MSTYDSRQRRLLGAHIIVLAGMTVYGLSLMTYFIINKVKP